MSAGGSDAFPSSMASSSGSWELAITAGNVLVMPGVPFSATAPARLIGQAIGADGQFFEFADPAFRRDAASTSASAQTSCLSSTAPQAPPATGSRGTWTRA